MDYRRILFSVVATFLAIVGSQARAEDKQVTDLIPRSTLEPKTVFYGGWGGVTVIKDLPYGFRPYICEGGGRYDLDVTKEGFQEGSYWVGGYFGVGATGQNGWKATGERWQHVIPEAVDAAAKQVPVGFTYVADVEDPKLDNSKSTDAEVEDASRRVRTLLSLLKKGNPLMPVGNYSMVPYSDYYGALNYGMGMEAYEKWLAGGTLTDFEQWAIALVATRNWDKNTYTLDRSRDGFKGYARQQAINDRLAWGRTDAGRKTASLGLADALDFWSVSCYCHDRNDKNGEGMRLYIKYTVAEARRLDKKKKAYVFMTCHYITGAQEAIPLDLWRLHVKWALQYADGIFLWDMDTTRYPDHVKVVQEEQAKTMFKN